MKNCRTLQDFKDLFAQGYDKDKLLDQASIKLDEVDYGRFEIHVGA